MQAEAQFPIQSLLDRYDHLSLESTLKEISVEFGSSVSLACSFGAEDVVLLDALSRIGSPGRVFVLDTGRLHEETYDLMERCRARYHTDFEAYAPQTEALQQLLRLKGPTSFYASVENRQECCGIRKVEPLRRALQGQRAWITGQRRGQAATRQALRLVEADSIHAGLIKFNPLAAWTEEEVWEYIHANDVPYNALHDQGYPSIGCAPCTRPITPGEDIRAGRWWWENADHKECGLHVKRA